MATKMETPIANPNVNDITRISAGTIFKGEINSPSDIRIDGEFEGKIFSCGRAVIGESAVVKGDVVSANIDIWGTVEGNIFVKDTLSLKAGCVITGNIQIHRLNLELGSDFNGTCKMITEEEFDSLSSQPAEKKD